MNIFSRLWQFVKSHKILTTIALVIVFAIVFNVAKPDAPPMRETVVAGKTSVVQEVDVVGRIVPVTKIDLSSENAGKVASIPVKVGQKVIAGETLLTIENASLQIRLQKQQAGLRKAQLALTELEKPAKTLTKLEKENTLARAQEAELDAQEDLTKAYEDGFNAVADAFIDIPSALDDLDEILGKSYLNRSLLKSLYDDEGTDYHDAAENDLHDAEDAYEEAEKVYRTSSRESTPEQLADLIEKTYQTSRKISNTIKSISNLLSFIEKESTLPPGNLPADQSTIDTLTADINSHNSELLTVRNDITNAEDALEDARRDIIQASEDVRDTLNGAEAEELERARIAIEEAELDIQDTMSQMEQWSIQSPIDGIVADILVDKGEAISPTMSAVSVISTNEFQIEAQVPESDITKITVGAEATVTLDSYGSDVSYNAKVSSINPTETLTDGVVTYKTTLQFINPNELIKSGLTADITVKGERRDDVLAIPQRAVITRGGTRHVRVLEGPQGKETVIEKPVATGLRGSSGNIEITQGLSEGETVIVFSENE